MKAGQLPLWLRDRFFYLLFACAVTVSVQLVGIYLVFATRHLACARMAVCYLLGALGYATGLALSAISDLPAGPLVVCTITVLGILFFLTFRPRIPT